MFDRFLPNLKMAWPAAYPSSAISEIDLSRRVCEMVSGQIYILGKCNNSSGISRQYLWWSWVNRNNARDIVKVTVGVSNSLAKTV